MSRVEKKARFAGEIQKVVARKRRNPPRRVRKERPATRRNDAYEINVGQSEYREAFNTGDVERLLQVFGSQFTEMSHGVPSFYGDDSPIALRHRMTRLFEQFKAELRQAVNTVRVLGDTGYSYGVRQLTLQPKTGGRPRTAHFRFFELWSKNEAGEWKLQMVIDNAEPPVAFPDVELPVPWFEAV